MKKTCLYPALAALILCGCAKTPATGLNDANKRYFDAWIRVNHPDAKANSLGVYILEEQEGTGALAGDADTSPYIRLDYVSRSLAGVVDDTNIASVARQTGDYEEGNYYGPQVWKRSDNALPAGVDDVISTMRVGGRTKFVVPGWLMTTDRYDTAADYLANVSGTPMIYEFTLRDLITDVKKWETDSVGRYVARQFPGKSVSDSLKYGFYYFRTGEPSSTVTFPEDTTIYINYTGRLLDGTVFDTTVKDTAKFYGIYSADRTYGPSSVKWYSADEDYTKIQLGSSEVINGFAYALFQMHPHEKGSAVFYSGVGYGTSGSGESIPGYAPLRFDIEIVDKP